jgi:hypothetical protein
MGDSQVFCKWRVNTHYPANQHWLLGWQIHTRRINSARIQHAQAGHARLTVSAGMHRLVLHTISIHRGVGGLSQQRIRCHHARLERERQPHCDQYGCDAAAQRMSLSA